MYIYIYICVSRLLAGFTGKPRKPVPFWGVPSKKTGAASKRGRPGPKRAASRKPQAEGLGGVHLLRLVELPRRLG